MSPKKYTFLSLVLPLIFSGCGELSFHLHPKRENLHPLTMNVGETKQAITQKDCTSLVGGYFPGLLSENPDIVSVTKQKILCGHETTLQAHKKGDATLCYVPVLIEGTQLEKSSLERCEERFIVHVE